MKLLMHMCCAPCSVYPVELLRGEGVEPEGLFYNPNIHPRDEYEHRRETVIQYAGLSGLRVTYLDGFMQEAWERFTGPEESRCEMCYALRMDRAAAFAKEHGFDAFTTSLLVSPYQKHELIETVARQAALRHGVRFYYRDFREGFRLGQQRAKELGLYRQKYCGCIVSLGEREQKQNKA